MPFFIVYRKRFLYMETVIKKTKNYVSNKDFQKLLLDWHDAKDLAELSGNPKPPVGEKLGKIIYEISTRYGRKPNFRNYPFLEDMIGSAMLSAVKAVDNYNPRLYSNPLAYFTQCVHNAFINYISAEKLQLYVKIESVKLGMVDYMDALEHDESIDDTQKSSLMEFCDKNESMVEFGFLNKKKAIPKAPRAKKGLELLIED